MLLCQVRILRVQTLCYFYIPRNVGLEPREVAECVSLGIYGLMHNLMLEMAMEVLVLKMASTVAKVKHATLHEASLKSAGIFSSLRSTIHFFSARRFERATPKRPSIVKCVAVKRQPTMPHHTTQTDVGQI